MSAVVKRAFVGLIVVGLVASACSGDDGDSTARSSVAGDSGGESATTAVCADEQVAEGDDGAAVVAAIEEGAEAAGLTSVVYRVTSGDEVVASGAIGESPAGQPANTDVHFRVGNVGFAYLGTLLLVLADDGEVSLDDTVASLLPDLDVPNADRVTLEMLANNTSGYPDYVRMDAFVDAFLVDRSPSSGRRS